MSPLHVHCLHLNSPYCRFRSLNLSEPSIMVTASVLTQRLPSLAPPCGPNNAIPFRLVLLGPLCGAVYTTALHTWALLSLSLTPTLLSPLCPRRCSAICLSPNQFIYNFFSLGIRDFPRGTKPCSPRPSLMPGVPCILHTGEIFFITKFLLFCRPCSSDLSVTECLHASPSAFVTKPSNHPCLGGLRGTDRAHSRTCRASLVSRVSNCTNVCIHDSHG